MQIKVYPEDIVKMCLWDNYVYYIIGSEKEAEKILKENKELQKHKSLIESTVITYLKQINVYDKLLSETRIIKESNDDILNCVADAAGLEASDLLAILPCAKLQQNPTKDDIIDEEKLNEDAKKHAENYNKLFPPKHPNLSDDECDRLKDVALGSHYIGYKQGYKNAKNK